MTQREYVIPPVIGEAPSAVVESFPEYFRVTSTVLEPGTTQGVIITPGNILQVPSLSCDVCPRCCKCGCYFSHLANTNNLNWVCPFDGSTNTLPDSFDSTIAANSSVYDTLLERNDSFTEIFCIAIDISINASKRGFLQREIDATKAAITEMSDNRAILLITFDSAVTVYDPTRRKAFTVTDFDDIFVPEITFSKLDKAWVMKVLDEIGQRRCTKYANYLNLLKVVKFVMNDRPCSTTVMLSGRPADVFPGTTPTISICDEKEAYQNIGLGLNLHNISVNVLIEPEEERSAAEFTGLVSSITSGKLCLVSDLNALQRELSAILTDVYMWGAVGRLRTSSEISVTNDLSCGVVVSGASRYAVLSASSAVSYELKINASKKESAILQYALLYLDCDGVKRVRVFTYRLKYGSSEEGIDKEVQTTIQIKSQMKSVLEGEKTDMYVDITRLARNVDEEMQLNVALRRGMVHDVLTIVG